MATKDSIETGKRKPVENPYLLQPYARTCLQVTGIGRLAYNREIPEASLELSHSVSVKTESLSNSVIKYIV